MIWFTADTHFGHANILLHQTPRLLAFKTIENMDAKLIDKINQYVQPNDELWILGDFAWKASRCGHYRQRLRVKKLHIVYGNHDSTSLRQHVSSAKDMVYRKFNGIKFHLTHYPLVSWRAREYGTIHLYGHCHGTMERRLNTLFPDRRAMDVGIDNMYQLTGEWRPLSFNEICDFLRI
jgi:calcineurin-like phosphoesterase family protein